MSEVDSIASGEAQSLVSDGVNENNQGFYFLPPIANAPSYSGTFDAGLSPVVEICETTDCEEIHTSLSMDTGSGSETVRLDEEDEHYIVNWHTRRTDAESGQRYRIRVLVDDVVLGHTDVELVNNGRETRNIDPNEAKAIVNNRTLPIRFRAETGIPGAVEVTPTEATIETDETKQFTAEVLDLHGEPLTDFTVEWSSEDEEIATVDSDGLAVGLDEGTAGIIASAGTVFGSAMLTVEAGEPSDPFVTTWDTNLGEGTTVTLGFTGTVDATIDWGDGTIQDVTTPGEHEHEYAEEGEYTVSVTGSATGYSNNGISSDDRSKLMSVDSWGDLGFENLSFAFSGAINLTSVPNHTNGLENVTLMGAMFSGASSFNQPLDGWDVSKVTNMRSMFQNADSFNQPLDSWDVSKVTNMSSMFENTESFNASLNGWDVSKVTTMRQMFRAANSFNQPLDDWNVSNVTNMGQMFEMARSFNQDLSGWCVNQFSSPPIRFDFRASSWRLARPAWGTCPS
ncbi:MAG: BspA family leucine-rich repeat surface protein [Balneolaceae bacterium]|nr:BspA family leucine-rich repeat surface protein [Balneolaceae bacterium]